MALAVEQLAADRSRLVAALGETEDWTILAASHKAGVTCTVHMAHAKATVSGNPEEEKDKKTTRYFPFDLRMTGRAVRP